MRGIGVLFYGTHKDTALYTSKYGSLVMEEPDRLEEYWNNKHM